MHSLANIKPEANQDCSRCRHLFKCRNRRTTSGKPLSDRNDTINLLVCRLKIGINPDQSAAALLQLLRPGMVNIVADTRRRSTGLQIDFDEMLAEIQSFAIESIMVKYRIGELNPITNFLFDRRSGYLIKWARWYATKSRRFHSRHVLSGTSEDDESNDFDFSDEGDGAHLSDTQSWDSATEAAVNAYQAQSEHTLADDVNAIIENGVTLNTNEYRAIKFCLQNANDSNDIRMIDGLHIHLANIMGVSRPRVTRLYKRGKDKLVSAIARKKYEVTEED